jgi:6,7-dimethyl-8-ribityllumazine synthase
MATTNLSNYNFENVPSANAMKIAIVFAKWNNEITDGLLNGAMQTLSKCGCKEENILLSKVPGSFELALGAQFLLQKDSSIDAVICLGSVIQGETKHFDYVCQTTALGIKDVSLKFNKPVIFGVLTDNTQQQAIDRSGGKLGNKGVEAAVTAIEMVHLKNTL